jgi:hypothetical protein
MIASRRSGYSESFDPSVRHEVRARVRPREAGCEELQADQPFGGGLTQPGRMPLTKFGTWRFTPFAAGKNIKISRKGGEERRYRFPPSRMYDMTLDGDYSIVVNRTLPGGFRYNADGHMLAIKGNRPAELMSNELRVVVSEAAAPE